MKTKNQPVKVHSTVNAIEKKVNIEESKSSEKQSSKTPTNLVVLTGHLGKDPVINEFDGGRKKAFFTMATNVPHYNKEGAQVEETAWHSLVAWGKLADTVQTFLRKGDKVSVTGRLNYHNYTDKSGVKKIFTEIIMNSLEVFPHKQGV